MKRYMSISLAVVLAAVSLSSCEPVKTPSSQGNGGTNSSVPKKLELTSFSRLNQGKDELNSHAADWKLSSLKMDYRTFVSLGSGVTTTPEPTYGRMIRLQDGSYILMCQDRADNYGNGRNVYWATSPDMKEWTAKGVLFKSRTVTNGLGNEDTRMYTNGNGFVKKNGDILLFASYRNAKSYGNYNCRYEHGIEMIRSTDGGKTWSQPYEIHHGPNWEAMILELATGELQCFFSESRPWISGSHSGTSMVRSTDGGITWTPSVKNADPLRIIRHTWYSKQQNKWLFTDQMPALVILNGSNQFAGAFESAYVNDETGKHFKIAFAWSPKDGKWDYITGDEGDGSGFDVKSAKVGPAERALDLWVGVGPDLKQFPSGETVLTYTDTQPYQRMRIGDSEARNWNEPFISLPGVKGSWGAMCMKNNHEVVALMRNSADASDVKMAMASLCLNHNIKASSHSVKVDGDNADWLPTDEALFVGSKCQAQATLRCSADADNIYFLIECLDENVSKDDYVQVFLAPADQTTLNTKSFRAKIGLSGLRNQGGYAGGWLEQDKGTSAAVSYDATLSSKSDTDNGWLAEIAVPRSAVNVIGGKLKLNFALFDVEGGEDAVVSTGEKNPQYWITVSGL